MRRLIVAAVVVVLGVGAGSFVAASASSDDNHSLTFIQHDLNTAFSHQPPSPGDTVVVQSELLTVEEHHKVGNFDGTCVIGFGHLICQGVAEFPGKGDITLAGEFVEPTGNDSPTGTVAITGGTGRYRGAKGEHRTTPIDATNSRVTFSLNNNG